MTSLSLPISVNLDFLIFGLFIGLFKQKFLNNQDRDSYPFQQLLSPNAIQTFTCYSSVFTDNVVYDFFANHLLRIIDLLLTAHNVKVWSTKNGIDL